MMNKKKSNEREEFFKKKYQYKITKRRNLKLFIKNITLLNIGKNRVVGNNRRGIRSTFQMPEKQGDKDNMSGEKF